MPSFIASPFLDDHLVLRQGSAQGIKIPARLYDELSRVAESGGPPPGWLVDAAQKRWGMQPTGRTLTQDVIVRKRSPHGFCRASYELNLGCNYDCEHCYLGLKKFEGLALDSRKKLLRIMRDAGVLWLQLTGGEPLIDQLFEETYEYAYDLGMMISISSNGSRLYNEKILDLLTRKRPYRLTLSVYGGSATTYDALTKRRGSYDRFSRGLAAGHAAGLPITLNLILTNTNVEDEAAMEKMADDLGLPHMTYTNMSPTIYGGAETLPAQSVDHLRKRKVFAGCHAGHTFFHADPHGKASICKVGRDPQIDLIAEGVEGLHRLGGIADSLMLRTGGCSGCALSGSCGTCRPLAKLYQEAKAPLASYCQHGGG